MIPAAFPQANANFGLPPDMSESQVARIPAYVGEAPPGGQLDGAAVVITAWQPTATELERLNAGAPVFLTFMGGLLPHCATTSFEEANNIR